MKSKTDDSNKKSESILPQPLLIWQEASQAAAKQPGKVIDIGDYRRSQEALSEASIISWSLPAMDAAKPVKLIMVSSGFNIRSLGANTVQSMAA